MAEQGGDNSHVTRRAFLGNLARGALAVSVGGTALAAMSRSGSGKTVWQIDPFKCIQCGRCRYNCVLDESAVKCVHDFKMCGYCDRCFAFFHPQANAFNANAENQLCPAGAIVRRYIEEPYFEYTIDEGICTGCGTCVKNCTHDGNGSLYLQVRHDRCLNCNECSIAANCPSQAFMRLPADRPYIVKHEGGRSK